MTPTVPAEWAPHRAMWLGFPSHAELWQEDLDQAQDEVAALARALAGPGGERVRLMVVGDEAEAAARARLGDTTVEIVRGQLPSSWLLPFVCACVGTRPLVRSRALTLHESAPSAVLTTARRTKRLPVCR